MFVILSIKSEPSQLSAKVNYLDERIYINKINNNSLKLKTFDFTGLQSE